MTLLDELANLRVEAINRVKTQERVGEEDYRWLYHAVLKLEEKYRTPHPKSNEPATSLLDDVKTLYKSVQNFDDIESGEACESSQELQIKLYNLRGEIKAAIVRHSQRHSQPLTPEAVVEWMESKGSGAEIKYPISESYHLIFDGNLVCLSKWSKGWEIGFAVKNGKRISLPLSRFRSRNDLETLVRLLGVGDE